MEPDIRDEVVDFVDYWRGRAEVTAAFLLGHIGLGRSKYHDWKSRHGLPNDHNGRIPRDFWLEEWERQAIRDFYVEHPDEGYRRCAYMMLDEGVVAASPATVYRVLRDAELMRRWNPKPSGRGDGFRQPTAAHRHWHVDISYLNIKGTFYYFCGVLDGYSRYIVHWEIRESMTEADVEIVLQRARERFPEARPRIVSDNGPQFVARDFKEFVRIGGMTHVRTSPYYPQSNGKLERFHGTMKSECVRPKTPLSLKEARRIVEEFVRHYNDVRLHSAIGYIAPRDKLEGREESIFAERDRRLEEARLRRRGNRRDQQGREGHSLPVHSQHNRDRSGRHAEPGISAPRGPSEHGERVMPEGRLTEARGSGIEQAPETATLERQCRLSQTTPLSSSR